MTLIDLGNRTPQQPACDNCMVGGAPLAHRNGSGSITFSCAGCGSPVKHAYRDGVPIAVWGSLVDNEDEQGRVPKDPDWNPRT